MTKDTAQFARQIEQDAGSNLVSLVLFGSAAGSDFSVHYSDVNLLCVLEKAGAPELARIEPAMRWWCGRRQAPPWILAKSELADAARCFPLEFLDLASSRRVLAGADVLEGLSIDESHYHAEIEQELRAKLMRLRQRAACVHADRKMLTRLMADSVGSFLTLARHRAAARGFPMPSGRRETAAALETQLGVRAEPFSRILDIREGKFGKGKLDAAALFAEYLAAVEALVQGG